MSELPQRFDQVLAGLGLPPGPALVAVSGGPDSVALLHLLARATAVHHLALIVAHVDHGIHPASDVVATEVARQTARLGLPFVSTRLSLGPATTETRAREARYRWLLGEARQRGALLLTAHHRDDQVETVLMRFLNGSGPGGLAAMSPHAGRVVRPLLAFSREELHAWVTTEDLRAWEDPSNLDSRHLRGWMRAEVLPLLEARLPRVRRAILRTADAARTDRLAWDALLEVLPLGARPESAGISVASAPLRGYSFPLGLALVVALARRVGLSIGAQRAGRILHLLQGGRIGARLDLGGGWIAESGGERFALVRPMRERWEASLIAGPSGELAATPWRLRWRLEPAPASRRDGWCAWLIPGEYQVSAWCPGDRIRPLGGVGGRLVVRCMQDCRVPRHQRSRWPVVRSQGTVIWVPGVCRAEARVPPEGTEAMRIDVEHT